jgi:hypothetical protein
MRCPPRIATLKRYRTCAARVTWSCASTVATATSTCAVCNCSVPRSSLPVTSPPPAPTWPKRCACCRPTRRSIPSSRSPERITPPPFCATARAPLRRMRRVRCSTRRGALIATTPRTRPPSWVSALCSRSATQATPWRKPIRRSRPASTRIDESGADVGHQGRCAASPR